MKLFQIFNFKRLYLLLKKDILNNLKIILITAISILGVLLIINISTVGSWHNWNFNNVFFPLTLLLLGFIMTSLTFNQIHNSQKSAVYLTLPASQIEKYLSRTFLTSIFYILGITILFFLFSVLASTITWLIWGIAHAIFNPFQFIMLKIMGIYLVLHSVFLFASIYFKKFVFIKTIASIIGLGFFFMLIAALIFFLVNIDLVIGGTAFVYKGSISESSVTLLLEIMKIVSQLIFWLGIPLFFWILGYIRFRESEVR